MKLTLLAHPTLFGANRMLLDRIKQADLTDFGTTHMVIVPDRYTLTSEQELLDIAGTCINIQVMTLRRFASMLLPSAAYVGKEACILILTKLIAENDKELTSILRGGLTYGLVSSLLEVIDQLKYSRVRPERLSPDELPQRLRGKLSDIRFIYAKYIEYFGTELSDSSDRLARLAEYIPYSELVLHSHFYIKDFDNFSAQELRIIEQLTLYSKSVTVAATYCGEDSHSMLYLNEVFTALSAMAQGLIRDVRISPDDFEIMFGNISDEQTLYMQKYFMTALTPDNKRVLPDKLTLYNGSTPSDEVRGLAYYISERLSKGEKAENFTVILSDKNRYRTAINAVFPEFEIPYFLDDGVTLFDTPLGQFVLAFFRIGEDASSNDRMISFAESFYFGEENDDVCAFRNYLNKYNCRVTDKPFAYERGTDNYVKVERIRQRIRAFIGEPLPKQALTSVYTRAARELLTACNAKERTRLLSEMLNNSELRSASYRLEQVEERLNGIIDSIESILGNTELELSVFLNILSKGMLATDISLIPIVSNCVEFIEMAKARRHNYKNVVVLGANEGVFPIVKGDFKLLSDDNLELLAAAGVDIRPSVRTLNQRERFDIYQLFLEPCQSLRISYSSVAPLGGKNLEPSICIKALSKIFTQSNGDAIAPSTRFSEVRAACPNLKCAENTLKEGLSDCCLYDRPVGRELSVLYALLNQPEISSLLLPPPPDTIEPPQSITDGFSRMSASRIETFYSCPYKHFLRYELKLKPTEADEEPTAAMIGIIVHKVLETGLRPYTVDKNFKETQEQTILRGNKIFDEVLESDEYIRSFLADEKNGAMLKKLKSECELSLLSAVKQIENSDFKPLLLEKRFGNSAEIVTKYGKTAITGVIDRIDSCGDNAIVIDYKTGGTEFKDEELYKGTKLQLTTYLTALRGELNTVGLYYMRLNDRYRKDTEKAFSYSGLTVNDPDTAKQIDNALYSSKKSVKLGIELKNDGELKTKSCVVSSEELESYEKYTVEMYKNAIERCHEGYIAPSPVEKACSFCDYVSICPYNDRSNRPER